MEFDIRDFYVVEFHFIDDSRCLRPLRESWEDDERNPTSSEVDQKRKQLAQLFSEAGWEGDGEINCVFLAPCFSGREDGSCTIIYHVKQKNNGTSWLAIPHDLRLSLPQISQKKS